MTPTTADTAARMIRILESTDNGSLAVSRVYERLSLAKKRNFSQALDLLLDRQQVRMTASPGGGWRRLHLVQPVRPLPHCPTCTCDDVL